ncbi:nuclease [Saccharobesus litoralis]|uniref:Nuclease n=1 Tax=Saccharobesus litoralis TaxID=2172099 RepID=A0A2S0VRZ9_9ALTE|nr:NYN domain-containing protein [Saccharobesus litoralis]AWB66942.1 nuclease [Saccharobesus litoralis]
MSLSSAQPKAAIFVDVQNIYYTCKQAYGRQFNYRQFWQQINYQFDIVAANAYAIASKDDGQRKFQDALRHIGFNVKLKPFIQRSDGSAKGDWDVGITVDMMLLAPEVDYVVLLSGDGDFDILLRTVSDKFHTKSQVHGVEMLTADSLLIACNQFQPILPADLL